MMNAVILYILQYYCSNDSTYIFVFLLSYYCSNSNTRVKNIHHLKSNTKMYNSMKATALHTRILVIYRNQWPLLKYENKNLGCIVIDLLKLILIYP